MASLGKLQNSLIDQMVSALTAAPAGVPAAKVNPNAFLLNPLWPEADWNISGAFGYDQLMFRFRDFFEKDFQTSLYARVSGAPPCRWNGERYAAGGLMPPQEVAKIVQGYTTNSIAVQATFTTVGLTKASLADPLGNAVLGMLDQSNMSGRNGVVVSEDVLARHVRNEHPGLKLIASEIKTAKEGGRDRAGHYRRLAEAYDLVTIHPEDNLDTALLESLEDKGRYEIIVNDPCWRGCSVRPAHDQLLSAIAQDPQNFETRGREQILIQEAGCNNLREQLFNPARRPLCLSSEELRRLYGMGYRHFRMLPVSGNPPYLFQFELAKWLLNHDPDFDYIPTRVMQAAFV